MASALEISTVAQFSSCAVRTIFDEPATGPSVKIPNVKGVTYRGRLGAPRSGTAGTPKNWRMGGGAIGVEMSPTCSPARTRSSNRFLP